MVDYAITPAEVKPVGTITTDTRIVGTGLTVVAGEVLYIDATTDTWLKATAGGAVEAAQASHVALNGASDGQRLEGVLMQRGTTVDLGAAAAIPAGAIVVLSANAGRHAPAADLVATNFSTYLCTGIGNNQVVYNVNPSGAQIP